MSLSGRTRLTGVMGWPVEHSLSPQMHNAAFAALNLDWCYVPLPVHPEAIPAALVGMAALGFRGANATIPHKQALLPYLDWIDPAAQAIGAANTLLFEPRSEMSGQAFIRGYNTDAGGMLAALKLHGLVPGQNIQRAVMVGAGGAARAVLWGLVEAGVGEIVLLNRDLGRAQALAGDLAPSTCRALPLTQEHLVESVRAAELLINTTPLGMWPHPNASIWPDSAPLPSNLAVFDLVYNPLETRLLAQARHSGALPMDGLEMLVQQGALAFELWTGMPAPFDVMRSACNQSLR
jgi:shikimate dehydrogenase